MKKIQLLTIMVLTGAVAFSAQATAHKAKVNFQESLARVESSGSIADLVIDSKEAIHGLQFDIKYNPEEIKSITPQDISGFEVKYNELSERVIRGLIFSLQGLQLTENLTFEFENVSTSSALISPLILPSKTILSFSTISPSMETSDNSIEFLSSVIQPFYNSAYT